MEPLTQSDPCSKCGMIYPRTEEYYYKQSGRKRKDGLRSWCKACCKAASKTPARVAYARRYYAKHRARLLATSLRYYAEHREARQAYQRAWNARNEVKHGTT